VQQDVDDARGQCVGVADVRVAVQGFAQERVVDPAYPVEVGCRVDEFVVLRPFQYGGAAAGDVLL